MYIPYSNTPLCGVIYFYRARDKTERFDVRFIAFGIKVHLIIVKLPGDKYSLYKSN